VFDLEEEDAPTIGLSCFFTVIGLFSNLVALEFDAPDPVIGIVSGILLFL
jgi:hypothetical protein